MVRAHAVLGGGGVVHLGPGVVEEGVVGSVVDVDLDLLAESAQLGSRARAAASGVKNPSSSA